MVQSFQVERNSSVFGERKKEKKSRNKTKSIILVDSLLLNKIALIDRKVHPCSLAISSLVTTRWVAIQNNSGLLHDIYCVYSLHGRYNVLIKECPYLFRFHNFERHTLNYMIAYGSFHISFHLIFNSKLVCNPLLRPLFLNI